MSAQDLYKAFGRVHPYIASTISGYGLVKGCKNTLKMRDQKGYLYIFQYENDEKWSLYYGKAAINFESERRNIK